MSRLILSYIILFLAVITLSYSQIDDRGTEAYFSFSYTDAVKTDISAYSVGDSLYYPILEISGHLKIDTKWDKTKNLIEGDLGSGRNPFTIDLSSKILKVNAQEILLSDSSFLIKETDVYFQPSIFESIFKVTVYSNMNRLTLEFWSRKPLPVLEMAQKIQQWNRYLKDKWEAGGSRIKELSQLGDNHFSYINGMVLDYSIASRGSKDFQNYSYSVRPGLELLGGSLEGAVFGFYNKNIGHRPDFRVSWRYAIPENPFLKDINIGFISPINRFSSEQIKGITIGNTPRQTSQFFSETQVTGKTNPFWPVELYRNNIFVGVQRADSLGNYSFNTELLRGYNNFDIKAYSENVEEITTSQSEYVPHSILKSFEVRYKAFAGLSDMTKQKITGADVSIGVFNVATFQSRAQYTLGSTRLPYMDFGLYSRLTSFSSFDYRYAPGLSSDLEFLFLVPFFKTINLNISQPLSDNNPVPFTTLNNSLITLRPSAFRLWKLPVNLQISRLQRTGDVLYNGSMSSRIQASFFGFSHSLSYDGNALAANGGIQQRHVGSYMLQTSTPKLPLWLGGPIFSQIGLVASTQFDIQKNVINSYQVGAAKQLFNIFNASLTYNKDLIQGQGRLFFNLGLNYGYTSDAYAITTGFQFDEQQRMMYDAGLDGSISFDVSNLDLDFYNYNRAGRGSVIIRAFLDTNNNRSFDDGEQILQDAPINISKGKLSKFIEEKGILVDDLQPFETTIITINEERIINPLHKPLYPEFTFVAAPNAIKQVDVPFYIAGTIDGKVNRKTNGQLEPLGGLTIHIEGKDKVYSKKLTSFNDGSFYMIGIPPGEYKATIDSTQLGFLKSVSNPTILDFTVKVTSEGDFVEGLSFEVIGNGETVPTAIDNIQKGFYILLNTYTSKAKAERALAQYNSSLQFAVEVGYDTTTDIFYTRSRYTGDYKEAVRWWKSVYASGLPQVANIHHSSIKNSYLFALRTGNYNTFEKAKKAVEALKSQIKINITVDFNYDKETFCLVTMPLMRDMLGATGSQLSDAKLSFDTVAVEFTPSVESNYNMEFKTFNTRATANDFANKLKNEIGTDLTIGITFDAKRQQFVVLSNPFEKRSEIERAIEALKKPLRSNIRIACTGCR